MKSQTTILEGISVNPWLAEKLSAYCSDPSGAEDNPAQALYQAMHRDRFLQTLRANLNLPSVILEGLYWCRIDTVADLLQFTEEELSVCAAREGFDPTPVRWLLREQGYTFLHAPQRTWKLSSLPVLRSKGKGEWKPWTLASPGDLRTFDISRPMLNAWWCDRFFAGYAHVVDEEKVTGEYLDVAPPISDGVLPADYSEFFQSVRNLYDAYEKICRSLDIPIKIAQPSIPIYVEELQDFTNDRFLASWRNCCRIMTDVFERTSLFRKSSPGEYLMASDEGKLNIAEEELDNNDFQLLLISFVENKIDFENVLIFLKYCSMEPRKQEIGQPAVPVNPRLAELILAYRSQHDDASLRKLYYACLAEHPDKSWSDFLAESALKWASLQE